MVNRWTGLRKTPAYSSWYCAILPPSPPRHGHKYVSNRIDDDPPLRRYLALARRFEFAEPLAQDLPSILVFLHHSLDQRIPFLVVHLLISAGQRVEVEDYQVGGHSDHDSCSYKWIPRGSLHDVWDSPQRLIQVSVRWILSRNV